MIRLEPIGPDNWREPLEVREDQKRFVSSPDHTLARALYEKLGFRPLGEPDGDENIMVLDLL